MAEQVTTLFIGDDAVNLLVVEGRRVKKWVSLPLEPGLVNQGLVMDEAKVASEVNRLFQLAKIGTRRVIAGISGPNSLYRLISLPQLPEAILPEAVKQEARRVIPMPLDEVYISYQRLPAPEGETRVFLAAFSRNVTDVLIRTLRQAGVQPYIMDLAPLALCRALNEPRAIIVNIRLDHVDVMVVEDRLPQLIHRLSLAGEVISLSESLPAIAEEVDRAITFYNSSHKRDPLDSSVPMFVCGDLTNGPESWQPLAGRLKCPVSILPSPVESPDGFNPSDFMVNIGLALKKLQPAEAGANFLLVNFNALPEVYQPKAVRLSSILVPLGVIIVIGLLIGMGIMTKNKVDSVSTLSSQLTTTQSSITEEMTEIATLTEQFNQVEAQLESAGNEAETLNATLLVPEFSRELTNYELHIINSLLPGSIDLVEINYSAASIMVSGIAPNEYEVFGYAGALRAEFGDVVISSIEAEEGEGGVIIGYRFELLLRW